MKQNVMKRTLAGILAVLTVAAYMPANVGGFLTESTGIVMGVSAEPAQEEAEVTSVTVTSENAEEVLTNMQANTTYIVNEDVSVSGLKVTGAGVVLKTETGATITTTDNTKRGIFVNENASLEVMGAGSSKKLIIDMAGSKDTQATVNDYATLTVGSYATIQGTVAYFKDSNVNVKTSASIITEVEDNYAISGNNLYPGGSVNITGGTVKSTNGIAIYHPDSSSLNISGGTITGTTAVYTRIGTTTISGGTLNATGVKADPTDKANGADSTGDALVAQSYAPPYGVPAVNITGGTFNSANGDALACYTVNESESPNVSVTGGTFKNGSVALNVSAYYDTDTFTQDDNGKVVAIATIAYEIINNTTGKKTFGTSTTGQIQIGNETVKLLKDVAPVNVITSTWASTTAPSVLDLNGHNVTCTSTSRNGLYPRSGHHLKVTNTGENKNASITLSEMYAYVSGQGSKLTIDNGVTINGEIAVFENATLDVYGTVKTTREDDYAISGNRLESTGSTINIYDGASVESTNGVAIYHPQDGTLNVQGGTITGKTAIYARTGTVNIFGGTLAGTGAKADQCLRANGADATGDAVVFQAFTASYGNAPVVSITGGDFSSTNAAAVATYEAQEQDAGLAPTGFITGGTFSTDVSAYVAEGYAQDKDGVVNDLATSDYVTITTIDVNGNKTATKVYPSIAGKDTFTVPKAVYLDGMEFLGWYFYDKNGDQVASSTTESDAQATADSMLNNGENFSVETKYSPVTSYRDLSVEGGVITSGPKGSYYPTQAPIETSTVVKVTADNTDYFSYWVKVEDEKETIVSYNPTYVFYMPEAEVVLRAVYNVPEVEPIGTGVIESVKSPNTKKLSFVSVLNIPDGCKMLKAGVVAKKTSDLSGELTSANATYVRYTDTSKNSYKTFKYTWTKNTSSNDEEWTVRPYLEYKDKNGKVQTVYGEAVSKSINQLN